MPTRPSAAALADSTSAAGFELRPPAMEADAAVYVLGDYELLAKLGRGGMGVVYRARQRSADRIVALKIIRPDRLADVPAEEREALIARFRTEARAAARLEHDHIVTVYDVGEAQGHHFYSMRHIEGQSLSEILVKQRQGAPLSNRDAVTYLEPVARAVHYAHTRNVLHRDLKPGNILISSTGRPFVADFGLAKLLEEAGDLTQGSGAMGTPAYMSPEQLIAPASVAAASDVYGLGATLYALVTGRAPFQAATVAETYRQIRDELPVSPRQLNPAVDRDLETICLTCLQKEPARRYSSAQALADDLRRYLDGEPIQARPVSRVEKAWRWCRRNPVVASLMATVAASLLAGTAVSSYFAIQAGARAKEAVREKDRADKKAAEAMTLARQEAEARAAAEANRYASDVTLVRGAWDQGNTAQVLDLLEGQRPRVDGQADLRGWEWHYLWQLGHRELRILTGQDGAGRQALQGVVFYPDGARVAAVSSDGSVGVWQLADARKFPVIKGHSKLITSVAFSPNGAWLASVSQDRSGVGKKQPAEQYLKVWDAHNGRELWSLKRELSEGGAAERLNCVAFSRDTLRVVTGGSEGTIDVWESANGHRVHTLHEDGHGITSVAFGPDDVLLVSGSNDGRVTIWDLSENRQRWSLRGHENSVGDVVFSPDGTRLASAESAGIVKVWNVAGGQEPVSLRGHAARVTSMAFSPDGTQLATGSKDKTLRMWDTTTGQPMSILRGHTGPITSVAFAPAGWRLASAGSDGTVRIWNVADSGEMRTLKGHTGVVYSAAFSPDSSRLASGSSDGTVRIRDIITGQVVKSLPGHEAAALAFSPDGTELASGGNDRSVRLWKLASEEPPRVFPGHTAWVSCVAYSPDGACVASASADHSVRVWDVRMGRQLLMLGDHTREVTSVAFSPDGHRIASGSLDRTVKLWNPRREETPLTLSGVGGVLSIAFSPSGKWLAAGGFADTVKIWNVSTGTELQTLKRQTGGGIISLTFTPDEKRLAAGSIEGAVTIWDVASGRELLTLVAASLETRVNSVTFSKDGRWLAAACFDHAVRLWDAGRVTHELRVEKEALALVEFLWNRPLRKLDVISIIKAHQAITDEVRDKALALAEPFQEQHEPKLFNDAAWATARTAHLNHFQYQFALCQAEAACALRPNDGLYLATLGAAQYRMGRYKQAADTLTAADKLVAGWLGGSTPTNLAFIAMAQTKLNEKQKAHATLLRLQETMKQPRWAKDPDAEAFLREARACVGPDSPDAPKD